MHFTRYVSIYICFVYVYVYVYICLRFLLRFVLLFLLRFLLRFVLRFWKCFLSFTFWFWFGFFLVSGRGFYNYYLFFLLSFLLCAVICLWLFCRLLVLRCFLLCFSYLPVPPKKLDFLKFFSLFFFLFVACRFLAPCLPFFCVFFTLNLWGDLVGKGVAFYDTLRESSRGKGKGVHTVDTHPRK